jgi:FG-GAP-like repeat
MTRLSATATIAALLLLAIAQGFGATSPTKSTVKSSPKIASKSTAKPYHVTAQNQFHFKPKKLSAAKAARMSQLKGKKLTGPETKDRVDRTMAHMPPVTREHSNVHANARTIKPRRNQTNPPTGHIGFVSATQVSAGGYLGDTDDQVLTGTLGGATALITVVDTGAGCAYSEVVANGDGTFTTVVPASPATLTLVPDPTGVAGDDCGPAFIVGDLNGDGNTDIVQADNPGYATILLSNGDGTFTATAGSPFTVTTNGFTGGALVTDATSTFLDIVFVDDACDYTACPSNIVTVTGNGDGTFNAPSTPVPLVPTGSAVGGGFNVIITDYDGDGTVDVSEDDYNTDQLNVYLFATPTTPYTGAAVTTPDGVYDACSSTAGSLTGSTGSPAIIEVNCDFDTVTVYNNAAGVFSQGVYYPTLFTPGTTAITVPLAATVADVNGDGNGDVVVTNYYGANVTVLLGNGDGTLQLTSVGYATGGYLTFGTPVVMDFNGDGLADILVPDNQFSLTWMAGYGDGTFQASKVFYSPVPGNDFGNGVTIASGDFNGDGFTDLVVANSGDTTLGITVFLSNPDGSLQPGVNYGSGGGLEFAAVGDFNGDGNLDIAASDYQNEVVQIFTGTGTGTFIEGSQYSTGGPSPAAIVAADFDGVNGTDLAVLDGESGLVTVLFNDGTGGFTNVPSLPITLTAGGIGLVAADVNGDGTPDLVISESNGDANVAVVLNGPPATAGVFGTEVLYPVGGEPLGIAVADVNGDGFPDIATPVDELQNIAVLFGKGDGTFNVSTAFPTNPIYLATSLADPTFFFTEPSPFFVQISDVDGDGFPDLVYTNAEYGTVGVLFGTGTGSETATPATPFFFDPVEFPTTGLDLGIGLADVNGDGATDAAVAGEEGARVAVLINANGTGALPNYSLSTNTPFINIPAGGTATAIITLTPVNFYNGTVTFSCAGLPLGATCAFAPPSLTPLGNAPLQTTLTVTTTASHSALRMPADANPHQGRTSLLACLTGMGLFGLLLSGDWKNKRNRRVGILLGILVLGMMFSLVGCSSSTTPGTPIGAQTIQVTGTGSDGTTNSVNLTINAF